MTNNIKKLHKSATDRKISGVCGGWAEYFGVDSTLIRLAFLLLMPCTIGNMVLAYLIMIIIMPEDESINNGNENNFYRQ